MNERLRRVEALAETLAHGQRADPQPGQGSGTTSSVHQDRSVPQSVPQPSFIRDVGETPSYDTPANPQPSPSTAMSTHHSDTVLHASGDRYLTSVPNVHIPSDEEVRLHPPRFQRVLFSWESPTNN